MEQIFQGIIIGMISMFAITVGMTKLPKSAIYRSPECGIIQQKGYSDTYFTVTTNTYQEYLQQELYRF